MEAKPVAKVETKVAKVRPAEPRKPVIKFRAHLVCLLIAAILTAVIPHFIHSDILTGFAAVSPNVLQETIDRLLHL